MHFAPKVTYIMHSCCLELTVILTEYSTMFVSFNLEFILECCIGLEYSLEGNECQYFYII